MRAAQERGKSRSKLDGVLGRWLAAPLTVVLAATLLQGAPAVAAPGWKPPAPNDVTKVKGVVPAKWPLSRVWSASGREVRGNQPIVWPGAQTLTVDVAGGVSESSALTRGASAARVKAGDLPVWLAPLGPDGFDVPGARTAMPPSKVTLGVQDRDTTGRAGVQGVLLQIARADGVRSAGRTAVTVDYSGFREAGGGDWASRLRMVQLPACALTTPTADGCTMATPLASINDTKTQTVTAVAPLAADGGMTVMAVSAAPSGDNGDYSATSLTPASTWDVSAQTGGFSWSYPLRMVPGVGGPQPTLSMSYSSQTMDGRTGGTNTQGSWIGDGFDMWPGYIERSYKGCGEDTGPQGGQDPNNKNNKTGDQCWWKYNASLSLNGRATELVDAGGGLWKGVSDDGSKVESLTGVSNGDNNGEYWKVTTIEGTQYFFGRNYGAGGATASTATDSTWTTEVYGNHPGDPGYVSGNFAGSRQTQAWRWNLDYVVDPHGNTMTLFYGKETGAYGRELDPSKRTTYDRGGYLTRIEYGNRADAPTDTWAAARVEFDVADRCKDGATCFDGQGKAIEASFPDTPFDQYCYAAPCTDKLSPTFWTQKRLAKIRTQVSAGIGSYTDVESWTLRHEYLDAGVATGEGIPMFLRGITRTGHVTTAGGAQVSDPEVVLDPGSEPLPNRVDNPSDNRTALNRWRIKKITTETGAQVLVDYKQAECTSAALPTPSSNSKLCFPQYYAPEGMTPTLDWFHKYVVAKVTANDNAAGSESQESFYDYLDTPAWHYDDSELVKEEKRTWGQFRGFGHVRVRKGFSTGVQLTTESRFLRGMDGDEQPVGVRDVWVADSWGNTVEDLQAYSGMALEQSTINGANGLWVSGTVNTPTTPVQTATSGPLTAWMVNTGTTRNYSRSTAEADGVRWTRSDTKFNTDNLPYEVDDLGDETTDADDRCTRTWYARNSANWMLGKVKKAETVGVKCATSPAFPADMISSSRTTYDNPAGNWDTDLPTRGLPVKVEELDSWNGVAPVWKTTATTGYDLNGRVSSITDALGYITTTVMTPALAGPVTQVDLFNPKNHKVTTTFAAGWNLPLKVTDANGVTTELAYDGLGRSIKVWLPGRATTQSASLEFDYAVRNNAPTAITSRKLLPTGTGYKTQITLYDGWLRERQTQTQAPGGGRVITETYYNSRGETWWASAGFYDASNAGPSTTLMTVNRSNIPSVTEYENDGAGRTTAEILQGLGVEKWRTVTAHAGDLTTVIPPAGGIKTETLVDARGQTAQIRRYQQRTGGTTFDATTYTYTDAGQAASVTDPAGNTWKYLYDQRGRKVRDEDPDKGITLTEYDLAGQAVKVTDARNISIATTYDELGRRKTIRDTTDTGPLRAEWFYDTLTNGIGKITKSVRHDSGNQYISEVSGYDTAGRTTGTKITIPPSEGALCAASVTAPCTYSHTTTYRADGQVSTTVLPKIGDLGAEQLAQNYNDIGAPTTLSASMGMLMRSVAYAKNGVLTQRTLGPLGKQVVIDYTIDEPTSRLTQITVSPENKPVPMRLAYSYDDAGSLTRIQDTPYAQTADTQCYRYDYLRRLTSAWTPGNGDCAPDPSTGAVGGAAPYWQSFEYSGAAGKTGSRTKDVWHTAAGDTTRTYTYPAQGGPAGSKPHALSQVDTDVPTGADTVDTYQYDNTGNTSTRNLAGVAQTLTWDNEGRLGSAGKSGQTVSYLYDADGQRLIRRDPQGTGTTLYLPGGQEVNVAPGASTAKGTRYYKHLEVLVGVRTAIAGLTFTIGDHNQTTETNIKASDLTVQRRRSLPFGDDRGTPPATWAGDKGFVGGTRESDGLTHLGARLYEPATGRFISVDPLIDDTDTQQMHGYAYGNNAPPTSTDPTGLIPLAGNDLNEAISSAPKCTRSGQYCGGRPSRPTNFGPKDDEFPYDPNATPTSEDWKNRGEWQAKLRGCQLIGGFGQDRCAAMGDSLRAYEHYWYGDGEDLQINLQGGYDQDAAVRQNVDQEIMNAQAAAEELIDLYGWSSFGMTGKASDSQGYPVTENWQKTLGAFSIWSSATVETNGDEIVMTIIVRTEDRWNFNRGMQDIASEAPDEENGRFQELGWADGGFNTHGDIMRKISWTRPR